MLLGYTVAKAPSSPKNSSWFTRLLLLVRVGSGDKTKVFSTTYFGFNFDTVGKVSIVRVIFGQMAHHNHFVFSG